MPSAGAGTEVLVPGAGWGGGGGGGNGKRAGRSALAAAAGEVGTAAGFEWAADAAVAEMYWVEVGDSATISAVSAAKGRGGGGVGFREVAAVDQGTRAGGWLGMLGAALSGAGGGGGGTASTNMYNDDVDTMR